MTLKDVKNLEIDYEIDKQVLNLHSSAIHIENILGLKSRLAWLYMVYRAFPYLKTNQTFTIQLNDLKKAINYTSKNNKILKALLKELVQTTVEWNILEKDSEIWETNSLLAGCKIDKGTGKITFAFSPFIQEKLCNPKLYAKINLIVSREFKSKHSLAIYSLAVDYLQIKYNYGEKNLTTDELKKYLGLNTNEYIRVVDLNKDIIKKAEKEINENSDIKIKIEPIRAERNKIIGFKLKMSIKEEFLDSYRPQKTIKSITENKQTNLFELPLYTEPNNSITKNEKIKLNKSELKDFFAEYKISSNTNTIQEKLKDIKNTFSDKFEDYLVFLMEYTKQELKRNSIKNVSGFYVGLLKDDNQLENYIISLQYKEKEQENKRLQIESLIETELKKQYENYLLKDFETYILKNIDKLEIKIINLIESTTKSGTFFYDVILSKHNNGVIDKTLLTETKPGTKGAIINHLKNYKDELSYYDLSFDDWKTQTITNKYLEELEKKLLNSLK